GRERAMSTRLTSRGIWRTRWNTLRTCKGIEMARPCLALRTRGPFALYEPARRLRSLVLGWRFGLAALSPYSNLQGDGDHSSLVGASDSRPFRLIRTCKAMEIARPCLALRTRGPFALTVCHWWRHSMRVV